MYVCIRHVSAGPLCTAMIISAGDVDGLECLGKPPKTQYSKTSRTGHGRHCSAYRQTLHSVARAFERRCELEADPRHSELIIEKFGLRSAKGVLTPGVCVCDSENTSEHNEKELSRSDAAGCPQYRLDMQHLVKELCREMSKLAARTTSRLKRVGKYLKHRPRLVWKS